MITFIDSNILIFSQIEELPENDISLKRLKEIKIKSDLAVNNIIISESFHNISRILGKQETQKRLSLFLASKKVLYLPVEIGTIFRAMEASTKFLLRINDAIIAQHAIDSKADGILTDNIKDFKKVSKLKVLPLR